MDRDGRYNHIEDVLARLHTGQWFTFTDANNKTYNDIIILDDTKDKPTEKSLTDAIAKQQSDFDAQAYARARQVEYPDWGTQLEKIDDDGLTRWREEMIDPVKAKWPKDNSGPV